MHGSVLNFWMAPYPWASEGFFQGGHSGIFPKFFHGEAKSGEIWFLPLKTKKTNFFAENFKIRGPPCSPSEAHGRIYCSQGRRQRGVSGGPGPPFKTCAPHFTFGPLVAAYIQYSIFKMWPPFWFLAHPSGFWPPAAISWRRAWQ